MKVLDSPEKTSGRPVRTLIGSEGVGLPVLPTFEQHFIEEALLINHRQFDGVPLTREEARKAIDEYRKFWQAHKFAGAPDDFAVPGLLIDRVWHTHICETKQYAYDCQQYFGKFFHHSSRLCDGGAVPCDW